MHKARLLLDLETLSHQSLLFSLVRSQVRPQKAPREVAVRLARDRAAAIHLVAHLVQVVEVFLQVASSKD
jgi:hypothetical protein